MLHGSNQAAQTENNNRKEKRMNKETLNKANALQFRIRQLTCLKEYLNSMFENYPLSVSIQISSFGNETRTLDYLDIPVQTRDNFRGMGSDTECILKAIDKKIEELETEFYNLTD